MKTRRNRILAKSISFFPATAMSRTPAATSRTTAATSRTPAATSRTPAATGAKKKKK